MGKRKKYTTNDEILGEFHIFHKTGVITEKLFFIFYNMCIGIGNKPCFINYSFKEDMVSEAYVKCINVIPKFDMTRPNPFGYFTTVIHNTCWTRIKKFKKESEYKDILKERLFEEVATRHSKVIDIRALFDDPEFSSHD